MSDSPAGWQPDPTGQHDHRYWDGTEWTDHVADAGVAGTDPYEATDAGLDDGVEGAQARDPLAAEPEIPDAEAPTAVTPVATTDTTATWPTTSPAAPLPYAPPSPVADGGRRREGKRRLVIGGAILGAVALAVVAFLALTGDEDEPTAPTSDGSEETTTTEANGGEETLEDLEEACAGGDLSACDDLYFSAPKASELETFGSTCGGIAAPQRGECEATNGGGGPLTGGFSEDELDDLINGEVFGLTEEQAECIAERVEDIVGTEGRGQQPPMAEVLEVFAECDISFEDLTGD